MSSFSPGSPGAGRSHPFQGTAGGTPWRAMVTLSNLISQGTPPAAEDFRAVETFVLEEGSPRTCLNLAALPGVEAVLPLVQRGLEPWDDSNLSPALVALGRERLLARVCLEHPEVLTPEVLATLSLQVTL